MANQLNLSVNELWALLTRTFEALYGHERDYYDMARTVLWLECHGHDGIEQLIEVLPVLEKGNLLEPSLSELSPGHHMIDGEGHSLLCIGRSICDLAMAHASEHKISHLDIINVSDSKPLIGVLSYAASQGFSAIATSKDISAIILSEAKHPTVYENNVHSVSLICAQTEEELSEFLPDALKVLVDVDVQKETYTANLEQGLLIKHSHYNALNVIANRVLVEATEASRQGAGE